MNLSNEIRIVYGKISEYDMMSAGISVLREKDLISAEKYMNLIEGEKALSNPILGRTMIGTMIEGVELSKLIGDEIKKYVDMFIEQNNIKKKNILEIAKDAVFLHQLTPEILQFGDFIRFRCKEQYKMLIEFPMSEDSKQKIKIYAKFIGLHCRYGKLNIEHECYDILYALVVSLYNKNKKNFYSLLRKFETALAISNTNIIEQVNNLHLINVFKEIDI